MEPCAVLSRGGGEPAVDAFSAWRPRCAGQAPCIGLPICIGKALYARVLGSARGGTQLCANACGKGTDDAPTGIGGCAAGKGIFAEKFKQDALILVAHSWGTLLGTLLCGAYPEGISAYLGSGQMVNGAEGERLSYEFVCEEAARRGDTEAMRELQRIGAPENGRYSTPKGAWAQRRYVKNTVGFPSERVQSGTAHFCLRCAQEPIRCGNYITRGMEMPAAFGHYGTRCWSRT